MNASQVKQLQIDHTPQTSNSPPPVNQAQTGSSSQPDGDFAIKTSRDFSRERFIVIGFVVATPIAIGGWLWLLGWIAVSIFMS